MTLLELCNRLALDCGVSSQQAITVQGVSGEWLRLKNWINDAYEDVQRKHPDWEWLRTTQTFTTTDAKQVYSLSDVGIDLTFSRWKPETFRLYVTGSGYPSETFLSYMDYETFRDTWQYNTNRTVTGRPTVFTITPDKSIALGMTPDATEYTIQCDYFQRPVTLSLDDDEPLFPARFQMLLVYMAMQSYAHYESAPEVLARGILKSGELMAELEVDQLPMVTVGTLI